jgi:hypothetical protein
MAAKRGQEQWWFVEHGATRAPQPTVRGERVRRSHEDY